MSMSPPRISKNKQKYSSQAMKKGQLALKQLGFDESSLQSQQKNWMSSILGQYLKYPSQQQANIHRFANRLGILDKKDIKQQMREYDIKEQLYNKKKQEDITNTQSINNQQVAATYNIKNAKPQKDIKIQLRFLQAQIKNKMEHCRCCGKSNQGAVLSCDTAIIDINQIGISTVLYFITIRQFVCILLSMLVIFGLFAIGSNLISSRIYKQQLVLNQVQPYKTEMTYQSFLQIALGSKQLSKSNFSNVTFQIQCWLGVLAIAYLFWRYIQLRRTIRKQEYFVDYITSSASDFTLQFSQIPIQYYDSFQQENIQQFLDQQRINILNSLQKQIQQNKIDPMLKYMLAKPILIYSIHKMSRYEIQKYYSDYHDQQFKNNKQQLKEIYKKWFEIILRKKQNISESLDIKKLQQLEQKYRTKKKQKKYLIGKQKKMKKQKAEEQIENNHKDFSAFVTFKHTLNKELVQRLHSKQNSLFYNLPCFKRRIYMQLPNQNSTTSPHNIIIEVAPEPEDIIWSNFIFGKYKRWSRVFLTFVATMLILTISFFLVYLLTIVQITISDETAQRKNISSTMMSFAISGVLFAVNMVIEMIINKLTKLQRHTSYTREQTSIAVKSIIAQLINMILIPIAINKIIKNNLFGVDGLADDVFYQAITFAILSPLLKVINIGAIKRILITYWYSLAWQRLKLSQKQLNKLYEFQQFQIGLEYVSVISIYLFAFFYAALQPIVLGIVAFGLIAYYFAQKVYLYLFSKRPTPGNHQISNMMWIFICLGPLFFAIGNFCWTDLLTQRNQGRVANTITLIIAIAIILFPYDSKINKKLLVKIREASFQDDRYIITSDYDRLDPLTRQQALKQYQKDKQKYWQLMQEQQRQQQIKQKLQDQKNYGDVYQQNYNNDKQSNYSQQDEQPYFQVYINIDKLHQQLEQLNQWVEKKYNDQEIRDIPYYTYYGNYGNNKLQIVQVNFYSQQIDDYIIHQNNQDQMGDNQLRNSIQCQKLVIQAHINNQDQQIIQQQSIRRERESQKRMQQTNNIIPQQKMTKDKRNARSTPLPRQYRQPF